MQRLLDFDMIVEPIGGGYRTRVFASPAGEAEAEFALPFTDRDLEILVVKITGSIGRGRRTARRIGSQENSSLRRSAASSSRLYFPAACVSALGAAAWRRTARTPDCGSVCGCHQRWPTSHGSTSTTENTGLSACLLIPL
jgi:hypothetical protein